MNNQERIESIIADELKSLEGLLCQLLEIDETKYQQREELREKLNYFVKLLARTANRYNEVEALKQQQQAEANTADFNPSIESIEQLPPKSFFSKFGW